MQIQNAPFPFRTPRPADVGAGIASKTSSPPKLTEKKVPSAPQPSTPANQAARASMPQWRQPPGCLQQTLGLLAAIKSNDWQAVEKAHAEHSDFAITDNNLMRLAAQHGAGKVVFHLQSKGIDPFGNDAQASAFHAALRTGKYDIARDMLEYVRKVNDDGALPDLGPYLEAALDNDDTAAISWLLNFSKQACKEMTFDVLFAAIDTSNVRWIELLLGHPWLDEVFSDAVNERMLLHYAIRKGSADTLRFLLDREPGRKRLASLCASSEPPGCTALHLAVQSHDPAKFELILGAHEHARLGKKSLDTRNTSGKTPLALALEAGQFDMADRLLESGAQPLVKSKASSD